MNLGEVIMGTAYRVTHNKQCDDLHIKYELYYPEVTSTDCEESEQSCVAWKSEFARDLSKLKIDYAATVDEIENLTNYADGYDYALAVSAGVISGAIDAFFVGAWDFKTAKAISNREINERIQSFAKKNGLDAWVEKKNAAARTKLRDANRLETAVEFLEEKFPLPGDSSWNGQAERVSTSSHHLDDLSHHPTVVGLLHSISSQYSKEVTYFNRDGKAIPIRLVVENGLLDGKTPECPVEKLQQLQGTTFSAKIACGFLNWCIGVAKNRQGHLHSDMAGSKATAGGGMGLPGTLLSLLKEFSTLPISRDPELPEKLFKAYAHGIGSEKNQLDLKSLNVLFEGTDSNKFDLRTENAVKHELNRQAVPVKINEIIVRCCYFLRRLIEEVKNNTDLMDINWKKVLPFKNRTIVRMTTISLGVFEIMDLGTAAIQATIKSGGAPPVFSANFILRVNFVGIGRFTIAGVTDASMDVRKTRLETAISSADVALAAAETLNTINTIEEIQRKTREHLNDVTAEIDEVLNLVF